MRKKILLLLLGCFYSSLIIAQSRTVSGKITDEEGITLPGASVTVKGRSVGTVTDFDGLYKIDVDDNDVLSFSYLGYETQEIKVESNTTIDVILMLSEESLDEVVVTAFGIKRNAKNIGYAVSKLKPEKVVQNSEPDIIRSIQGKVPGVDVKLSSGVAGASNKINIRGATSILGNNQPLIIVDGVAFSNDQVNGSSLRLDGGAYESGISSLDPNNIESINVLKSAAASALYGSRGSNGVIVITTKTGSSRKSDKRFTVSLSSGTYFEEIANLPEYQNTYGNGVNFEYLNANGSWGPRFDQLETIPTWQNYLDAFPGLLPDRIPYEAQPDNVKNLFKTGTVLENSLSTRYSGKIGSLNLTLSDLDQDGYIPFNKYDRQSIGVGGQLTPTEKIQVGASFNYSDTKQVGPFLGNNQLTGGASSFARALWLGRAWDFSLPFTAPDGSSVVPNGGYDHPLWSWQNDQIITNSYRSVFNFNVSYSVNDHLSFSYRSGVNNYKLDRTQIRAFNSRAENGVGSISNQHVNTEDIESTFVVNFNKPINKSLTINALAGHNVLQNRTERNLVRGLGIIEPGINSLSNTQGQTVIRDFDEDGFNDFGTFERRLVGVFGEIDLAYKEYAFLNITGRNDWSSTLPENNRSFFYPAINGALVFTDAFNVNSEVLTYGKIRASLGKVGLDAPAEFTSKTFIENQNIQGNAVIANNSVFPNQNIKPEFTTELELGTDLEFFKGRIRLDFTWYKKKTEDVISRIPIPITSGFSLFATNSADFENEGFEVGLDITPIKIKNFSWNLITNFTQNRNEVTSIQAGLKRFPLLTGEVGHVIEGEPFGVFFGTKFARDDEGNFIIDQATGGIVADPELGVIGDPNPDFRVTFINTFKVKDFSLRTQFDWKQGGDISSVSIPSLLGRGVTKDTEDRERTFVIPGFYGDNSGNLILDTEGNKIPNTTQIDANDLYFSPSGSNTFGINSVDEASIFDGTVFRLTEISLGYEMPKRFLDKLPLEGVNISIVGSNLWYFAPNVPKYTNFDPEITSFGSGNLQGIEVTTAPRAKRYGFRLNLIF